MKLRRLLVSGFAGAIMGATSLGFAATPAHAGCQPGCNLVVDTVVGLGWLPPWLVTPLRPAIDPLLIPLFALLPINELVAQTPQTQAVYSMTMSALSATFPFPTVTKSLPVNGDAATFDLVPGKWRIQVAGLYSYDSNYDDVNADAQCSLPHPKWRDTIDAADEMLAGGGAPDALLHSPWHSDRYGLGYHVDDGPGDMGYLAQPTDHVTRVYVDHQPVEWSPVLLPPVTDESGKLNDQRCDTQNHTYYEDILVPDFQTISVSIFDVYYADNAPVDGGLTVTVTHQM